MSNEIPAESVPAAPPNSNLAVVSIISGILGLTLLPLIGGIVALITGYMAKREIRESEGALGGDGLATAGLVMGWIAVGLLIIGLFCAVCMLIFMLIFGLSLYGISAESWSLLLST